MGIPTAISRPPPKYTSTATKSSAPQDTTKVSHQCYHQAACHIKTHPAQRAQHPWAHQVPPPVLPVTGLPFQDHFPPQKALDPGRSQWSPTSASTEQPDISRPSPSSKSSASQDTLSQSQHHQQ